MRKSTRIAATVASAGLIAAAMAAPAMPPSRSRPTAHKSIVDDGDQISTPGAT